MSKKTADDRGARDYKYTQEISQMVRAVWSQEREQRHQWNILNVQMFVFGEVQDPNQDTVNLVEDIVRSQIIELVGLKAFVDALHWLASALSHAIDLTSESSCK